MAVRVVAGRAEAARAETARSRLRPSTRSRHRGRPESPRRRSPRRPRRRGRGPQPARAPPGRLRQSRLRRPSGGSSPAASVFKALSGSTSGGGLGPAAAHRPDRQRPRRRGARARASPPHELNPHRGVRLRLLAVAVVLLGLGAHGSRSSRARSHARLQRRPCPHRGRSGREHDLDSQGGGGRGEIVRVNLTWSQVAPRRSARRRSTLPTPPAPDTTGPRSTPAVRDLTSQGLQVLLNITGAPTWAEGPGAPPGAQPGTWRPDPAQFASFATAAALRYDGRFPDPLHPGAFLPRVRYWQAWNEPNLDYYLSPQWTHGPARLGSGEPGDLSAAAERVLRGGQARLTRRTSS